MDKVKKYLQLGFGIGLLVAFWVMFFWFTTREQDESVGNGENGGTVAVIPADERVEIPVWVSDVAGEVIEHVGYTVSYNERTRLPNWVAYELTEAEAAGDVPRKNSFVADPLTKGKQATNDDYKNSGWDKGHMAPAGDMKWDATAMTESFYFTNICPQNHNLNGGDWKSLEDLSRNLAVKYGRVYIVCGPIVGEGKNGTIGRNEVVVPDGFFKVLLMETEDGFTSIGFIFDNAAGHKPLKQYAYTVNDVEARLQVDFFPALPDEVEETVEGLYEPAIWGIEGKK